MLLTSSNLPDTIPDIEALDELLCRPSQTLIDDLGKVDGDIIILGVAGKMGPTLAGLAKAALPRRRRTLARRSSFTSGGLSPTCRTKRGAPSGALIATTKNF